MTSEDIRSELQKEPFIPFRLHLVSGHTIEVRLAYQAAMLQNAILVFHRHRQPDGEKLYDVVSLRNIERIEQVGDAAKVE